MSCAGYDKHACHHEREQHCHSTAQLASYPEVRRCYEELAQIHAGRAVLFTGVLNANSPIAI